MSFQLISGQEKLGSHITVDTSVEKGTRVYKRSHKNPVVITEEGRQWFSFEPEYGASYGSYEKQFKTKRNLRLLDVAKTESRKAISRYAEEHKLDKKCTNGTPPLEYAWGEGCNDEAAETVCEVAKHMGNVDGWIARDWDDEALDGPREIMLCLDRERKNEIFGTNA